MLKLHRSRLLLAGHISRDEPIVGLGGGAVWSLGWELARLFLASDLREVAASQAPKGAGPPTSSADAPRRSIRILCGMCNRRESRPRRRDLSGRVRRIAGSGVERSPSVAGCWGHPGLGAAGISHDSSLSTAATQKKLTGRQSRKRRSRVENCSAVAVVTWWITAGPVLVEASVITNSVVEGIRASGGALPLPSTVAAPSGTVAVCSLVGVAPACTLSAAKISSALGGRRPEIDQAGVAICAM